jgi:malonate-semialdehyde dehydrogenase (acetylating)/methylmalonate-semialdehyde dehydrogenase
MGELLLEAGLPEGVFNIVHGDRECVEAILAHPLVRAVSFVGSTGIARTIYETASRNGKRVQAAGGAKNYLVVMPDADLEETVEAISGSAYGCAGQRCMAGSVVAAVGSIGESLIDKLVARAAAMRVGPTDGSDAVDMGPLIRREHKLRVAGYLDLAVDDGARIALDGRREFESDGYLLGPSIVDDVQPGTSLAVDEIFGPVLSVMRTRDFDSVLALGHDCPYGNGASIFTRDGSLAREFKQHFNAGMIGINVGVPAPMAWLPFSGWNQSFFGDLHMQGMEGIQFYTRSKVTLTHWFESKRSAEDPLWKAR